MHVKAILLALCLLVTGLSALSASPGAHGALINDRLTEQTGSTTILGGGDHVFVKFGDDAAFGVVYGTTANPNNVYLVAIKARYLGLAQAVDPQNRSVAQNVPIKIYTLYAVKLDSIVEYRDLGARNSIADYGRVYNSTTNRFTNYFNKGDTLYKKVDLNTNWTRSPITHADGVGYKSWTFNLTAQNLSYTNVANYTGAIPGTAPLVRFTFHLNASVEEISNATVPQWRVTVDTVGGRSGVTNVSRMPDLVNVSGKAVHYDLKWDQDIEGWSYVTTNTGLRARLFLELGAIVGNLIPAALVNAWFDTRAMGRLGETGTASYNTTAGTQRANDTTGTYPTVRPVATQRPSIDFGGNWTRIARLLWVGNAVVDGANSAVYGQIVAGVRFAAIGDGGNAFVGFALLAGLSFQGGQSIHHDPTVTTDVQAELQLPGSGGQGLLVAALVSAVAVVAVLLLVLAFVMRRRKRAMPPPPPPPEN